MKQPTPTAGATKTSKDTEMQPSIMGSQVKLSREVQRRLGDKLQSMFDEIVNEGVPDRFAKLLEQLDNRTGPKSAAPVVDQPAEGQRADPDTNGSR